MSSLKGMLMTCSPGDPGVLVRAYAFAAECHRDQRRKGSDSQPYINHLTDVARILWAIGGIHDIATIAAGILHDTIEDTKLTEEDLAKEFGAEIAAIVMELTDDMTLPGDERKRCQVEHADSLSAPAGRIKIADKISNIEDVIANPPTDWSIARRKAYVEWGKAVVDRIPKTGGTLEGYFDSLYERAMKSLTA